MQKIESTLCWSFHFLPGPETQASSLFPAPRSQYSTVMTSTFNREKTPQGDLHVYEEPPARVCPAGSSPAATVFAPAGCLQHSRAGSNIAGGLGWLFQRRHQVTVRVAHH